MDNKVNFLRGTSAEYGSSIKDNDTFYYTTDTEKLYLGNKEITGGGVTIDDTLSDTSKNPVQNKVINAALNSKAELTDIPTTLPANGGNADTLGNIPASELERVRTAIIGGGAAGVQWAAMQAKKDDTMIRVQVDAGYDRVLLFKSIDGGVTWTEIPLGNADTVDGKHASDFVQKSGDSMSGNLRMETNRLWFGTGGISQFFFENTDGTLNLKNHDGATIFAANYNGSFATNADVLDGFHETSFSRNRGDTSNCNDAVLPGTYNAIPSTVNTPYSGYWFVSVEIGASGAWIRQTATISDRTKLNETYRRLFINDRWSDSWVKVNDGGNAATVNGLTVQTAVPANAKFTDTTYGAASTSANGLMTTEAQTLAGNKTFNGQVIPAGASAVGTAQARKIYAGTSDMTAGTTALETGAIYLVYE